MYSTRRRRKYGIGFGLMVAAAALATLSLWSAGALAVFPDSEVESYASCLNATAGTFTQVAVGDSPSKPCGDSQILVHLSGGDITAVRTFVGAGISGGSENGKATISLDNTGCPNGGVLSWNGLAGGWQCLAFDGADFAVSNQSCSAGKFVTGIDSSGQLTCASNDLFIARCCPTGQPFIIQGVETNIITLDLPAGSYFITAKLDIQNVDAEDSGYACTLSTGDSVEMLLDELDGTTGAGDKLVALQDATTLEADGQITLHCGPTSGFHGAHVSNVSLAALRVSAIRE